MDYIDACHVEYGKAVHVYLSPNPYGQEIFLVGTFVDVSLNVTANELGRGTAGFMEHNKTENHKWLVMTYICVGEPASIFIRDIFGSSLESPRLKIVTINDEWDIPRAIHYLDELACKFN